MRAGFPGWKLQPGRFIQGINFDDILADSISILAAAAVRGFLPSADTGPLRGANIETELFIPLERV